MSDIQINFDGKTYDLDDFELGELEFLEDFVGGTLSDAQAMSSMKAAVGFVYILKRRDDPDFTVDQARKLKMSILNEADAPKPAAKKRPTKPAAR